jgi:hypothetical protein
MPVYHYVDQNSEAWERLRLGVPTASEFGKLVTAVEKRPSKQWKDHCYHLLAERILMRREDHYTSSAMIRGQEVQDQAADWYTFNTGRETETVGFIASDESYTDSRGYEWARYGCSPDRLIGDDGLLECKCPTPKTMVRYWFEMKADRQYWPQLQGQLFVSQRMWVDLIAWHEELPKVIIRVERDEMFIRLLERTLREVNEFLDGVMDKLGQLQERPPEPTPKATLREMLDATLGI